MSGLCVRTPRPLVDIEDVCGLRDSLLGWYDATHRLLPWRVNRHSRRVPPEIVAPDCTWAAAAADRSAPGGLSSHDFAYGVLVSEVMLQQTQVARCQEYFTRWVHRWPTAAALSTASAEEVNTAWAGLGYYRRAQYLLRAAQYAAAQPGGVLPATCAELRKVPGVGPYTAAAVASIAYGERVAAVDGNVVRVLSRLMALRQEDPTKAAAVKEMQTLADRLLHPDRPGDWNQAMMELGARICTPKSPACGECPVSQWCTALAAERGDAAADGVTACRRVTDFPVRAAKVTKREESVSMCVVEWRVGPDKAWMLLVRRADTGLLAGQWEFPSVTIDGTSSERADMDALLCALGHGDACSVHRQPLGAVGHVFSHVRWTMNVHHAVLHRDKPPSDLQGVADGRPWRWVELSSDGSCAEALTGGFRKVLAVVKSQQGASGVKRKDRPTAP